MTPYLDCWKANLGEPHAGKMAKFLRPLDKELGPEETLRRLEAFLTGTDPRYASVARFAETHKNYEDGKTPMSAAEENLMRELKLAEGA